MAKKLKPGELARSSQAAGDPLTNVTNELDILHPDREAVIAGRKIILREYGFVEGLKIRALARPFTDALYGLFDAQPPDFELILDIVADHAETVLQLAAIAADVEQSWVDDLNDEDGNMLLLLWWGANGGFFTRQLMRRKLVGLGQELAEAKQRASQLSGGQTFTQPLPPMGTTSGNSASTPSDS